MSKRKTVEPSLLPLSGQRQPADPGNGRQNGIGNGIEKTFKWLSIAGGAAFAVILGIVLLR